MDIFRRFWAWLRSLFGLDKNLPLPQGWNLLYSKNVPSQMTANPDGTFYFDFPSQDGVHYVLKNSPPLTLGQKVTMTFSLVGDGKLIPVDRDVVSRVRIMIQKKNDNLSTPDARWWSQPVVLDGPGDYTLTEEVSFGHWITIGGGLPTAGASGFADCVANIARIGFSFGGFSAGHGVYSQGPSRFILKSFTIG